MSRRIVNFRSENSYRPYDRRGSLQPGMEWVPLSYSDDRGEGTYFLRFSANNYQYRHDHLHYEEFFVLDGCLIDEAGIEYRRGDFVALNPAMGLTTVAANGATLLCCVRRADACFSRQNQDSSSSAMLKSVYRYDDYEPFYAYGKPYANVRWLPLTINQSNIGSYFAEYQAPSRSFPHQHQGYEEFLVFEGTLTDFDGVPFNDGDFVIYIPGSRHFSYTNDRAVLLVFMATANRALTEDESAVLFQNGGQ